MKKVEVYTKDYCPYCVKAMNLLTLRGIEYTAYDMTHDLARQQEMVARVPGARTVPQILIDGVPVGGCDDLYALDAAGELMTRVQG